MFYSKIVALTITFLVIPTAIEAKSVKTVTVMLPQNNPSALKRLEMNILENFGKKFKLSIEYVATNETLNFVFDAKRRFERFSTSAEYL